jgi:hypothetical protein
MSSSDSEKGEGEGTKTYSSGKISEENALHKKDVLSEERHLKARDRIKIKKLYVRILLIILFY